MLKTALMGAMLAAMSLAGAGQAAAQYGRQPQQRPQQYQEQPFMVQEAAMPPAEALRNAELLVSALKALPAQRPGVVDTYVLSASLWDDPVFEREAKEVAGILASHFDAAERTVILSAGVGPNGARTYATSNPNNIQAALARIGQLIDPKEDLVVVFITSHGAPNGLVAMQERNRLQGGIMPRHLRASLQAAGIPRKAVIVSACFSGNFVLPMGDPDTVVLTAAAADKSSFGCEPSRDWTYFGDAFFSHALRSGAPLLEAYDDALVIIDGWENKLIAEWERLPSSQKGQNNPRPEHSNPISHAGDNVTPLVQTAEAYGVAVGCAANLSFALDRARSGRPLKQMNDIAVIQSAKTKAEARAQQLAQGRGRTAQDASRAIAAQSAAIQQIFNQQVEGVSARASKCQASY